MIGLTDVDKKIVERLEAGKTPPEIAKELDMNVNTVYVHLSNIRERYRKAVTGDKDSKKFIAEIDGIKKRSPNAGYYLRVRGLQ